MRRGKTFILTLNVILLERVESASRCPKRKQKHTLICLYVYIYICLSISVPNHPNLWRQAHRSCALLPHNPSNFRTASQHIVWIPVVGWKESLGCVNSHFTGGQARQRHSVCIQAIKIKFLRTTPTTPLGKYIIYWRYCAKNWSITPVEVINSDLFNL